MSEKTLAPLPGDTVVGWLRCDAATAQRVGDLFAETYDPGEAAVATSEQGPGDWLVELHFRDPPDEAAVRALVALAATADAANTLTFQRIAARDWVATSLAGLAPVTAGRFVVHGAHDRARVPANRIGLEIEAALAFGTGHHGTTRGCLLALDQWLRRQRPGRSAPRVLDVGTGTGVLAIAAARALRREVVGSDIDPMAVRVARANARLNRAAALTRFVVANGVDNQTVQRGGPYDLILANILLRPLQGLATPLERLASPAAILVLSGLLDAQSGAALATYRSRGLVLAGRIRCDGWTTLILRRPGR